MNIRQRKLAGTVLLLVLVIVYALVAMAVAVALQVNGNKIAELVFYVVAGLAWLPPAAAIVSWMQRPERTDVGEQEQR